MLALPTESSDNRFVNIWITAGSKYWLVDLGYYKPKVMPVMVYKIIVYFTSVTGRSSVGCWILWARGLLK